MLKELFQAGANVLDADGTASNDLKVLKSMAETEHWLIPSQEARRGPRSSRKGAPGRSK